MKITSKLINKTHFKSGVSVLALTSILNMGMPAMAQDVAQDAQDAQDDYNGVEVIVVTATKRAVNVQDVAQAITAFSTADIERRGILDMADTAAALPSISLTTGRPGMNQLVYRGMSSSTSDWRIDSQVAMYFDDQAMTSGMTQLDPRMVDIQRIESLPGPQGTLFGSSSQTGTLRVITNKPSFSGFSGQVNGEMKSTKGGEIGYDFSGHVNVPLVEDKLAIRVVAFKAKDGGYMDNVFSKSPHGFGNAHTGYSSDNMDWNGIPDGGPGMVRDNKQFVEDNYNDNHVEGGRLSALWSISEDWDLLGVAMLQESNNTGSWQTNSALQDYQATSFTDEWRRDKWWSLAATLTGDLGWAQFTSMTSFSDRNQEASYSNVDYEASHTAYGRYYSQYYYPGGEFNYYDLFDTGFNGGEYRSYQPSERFSNEMRLQSTGESRFEWMVGTYFEKVRDGWYDSADIPNLENSRGWDLAVWKRQENCNDGYAYQCGPLVPLKTDSGTSWYDHQYDRDVKQYAVFGEFGYEITERLHVTAGARWFQYDRETLSRYQFPPGLPIFGSEEEGYDSYANGKESNKAFKASIKYDFSDDVMAYATFSQGFRLGGSNAGRAVRANFVGEFYDSDKMNNYEIGMKSEWFDNRLQINATAFVMKWNDIQVTIRDPDKWYIRGQVNAEAGINKGFEVDFILRATDNLKFNGNVYYGNPHYIGDYYDARDRLVFGDGTAMPNASARKFSAGVDWTIPGAIAGNDVFMRYDFAYRGGQYSELEKARDAGSYKNAKSYDIESSSMSNFQIGVEAGDGATVTLMVRNVFNQRSNTEVYYGQEEYAEEWGSQAHFGKGLTLARPRTFSLKYSQKF